MTSFIFPSIETLSWFIPLVLVFTAVSWVILKTVTAGKKVPAAWLLLLGGIAILARAPSTAYNHVTNIDESQTIAHALTLIRSPEPWKSIDFTTNGPLNAYVFFIPHWLGLHLDYFVSHIILVLLQVVLAWMIFVTIRNWMGRDSAVLTMIPLLAFLAFVQPEDFIHQNSETWCIVSLSAALAVFSGLTVSRERTGAAKWFIAGVLLGAVPFGKPQGAPPALLAALCMYVYLFEELRGRERWKALFALTAGGLAFFALFAGITAYEGAAGDFYDLFIRANLHYASTFGNGFGFLPTFLWTWGLFSAVTALTVMVVVFTLFALVRGRAVTGRQKMVGLMIAAILLGGAYAVERAGRHFYHYMLIFVFPGLFLLFGWCLKQLETYRYKALLFSVGMLLFGGYILYINRKIYDKMTEGFFSQESRKLDIKPVSKYVSQLLEPGDYLTVYGYYNEIYVETQFPSATRTVTVYQHSAVWPELYLPYYCRDLFQKRPAVFVDALDTPYDFWQEYFINRRDHSWEKIPQIREFIVQNYTLVKEVGKSRVYLRNDRLGKSGAKN